MIRLNLLVKRRGLRGVVACAVHNCGLPSDITVSWGMFSFLPRLGISGAPRLISSNYILQIKQS